MVNSRDSKSDTPSGNYAQVNLDNLSRQKEIAAIGRGSSKLLKGGDVNINAKRARVGEQVNLVVAHENEILEDIENETNDVLGKVKGWKGPRNKKGRILLSLDLEQYRQIYEGPLKYLKLIIDRMSREADMPPESENAQEMYEFYCEALQEAYNAALIDDTYFYSARYLFPELVAQQMKKNTGEPNMDEVIEADGLRVVKAKDI